MDGMRICIYDNKFWNSGIGKRIAFVLQWIDQDISGLLGVGASWFDNLVRKFWYDKLTEKLRMKKKLIFQKFVITKANILKVLNVVF